MPLLPPPWTPAGLTARLRSLWTALRRRDEIEADMAEEFRHHIQLTRLSELVGCPPRLGANGLQSLPPPAPRTGLMAGTYPL